MERTKNDFIKEFIKQAQDNVWKNELVLEYHAAGLAADSSTPLNVQATEEIIKKDLAYIDFLKGQCE